MNEDKARELAQQFGVRMCDENGETHGEELYCLGLDDIIDMAKALAQPDRITALRQKTESHDVDCLCSDCIEIGDLEDAMAQPEQKPIRREQKMFMEEQEFYTTPQQRTWVGLTDEEILEWRRRYKFSRALLNEVEAKLKGKNS